MEVKLLTIGDVADRLQVRPGYVYAAIRRGELRAVRRGQRWTRVRPIDLEKFIDRNTRRARAA